MDGPGRSAAGSRAASFWTRPKSSRLGPFTMLPLISSRRNITFFTFCCIWIVAVSAHDAVLVVIHHQWIEEYERNPVGRWLIQCGGGDVWLFVWTKFAGTATVCAVLVTLYRYHVPVAVTVAGAVASFQLLLLCYLHFG
jgi:hypothetical protein